jgi:hypothetical protein
MWQLRQALRRLLATPLFTMFAVLSLAVGVAVTTGVYSIVDAIFLSGLGVRDPDRVAFVVSPYGGRLLLGSMSKPDFDDVRSAQTSFSSISSSASVSLPLELVQRNDDGVSGGRGRGVLRDAWRHRSLWPHDPGP